ncbi:MAG TPA: penicillin-binding protein 2, partial [Anaeromyxobacteraceae bacterium]
PYFERDHAWFAAFAPREEPEIVVVVLSEHSGFGATHAAPTAAAVVRRWLELRAADEAERGGTSRPEPPAPEPGAPEGPERRGRGPGAGEGARGA